MNAIIIEDEPLAASELEHILGEIAPGIKVIACLESVRESVKWLEINQADLIFSDIHLGDGKSFEVFRRLEITTPVIFITAYDEYALEAFHSQGVAYILKPFEPEEIRKALLKVQAWLGLGKIAEPSEQQSVYQERFLVQVGVRMKSVPASEVAYFMADGKYLMLYTFEGAGYIVDQTMAALEGRLNPVNFFRINRKFIVNYLAIKDMIRYSGSRIKIVLQPATAEDTEVIVSTERMKEFKEWLNR